MNEKFDLQYSSKKRKIEEISAGYSSNDVHQPIISSSAIDFHLQEKSSCTEIIDLSSSHQPIISSSAIDFQPQEKSSCREIIDLTSSDSEGKSIVPLHPTFRTKTGFLYYKIGNIISIKRPVLPPNLGRKEKELIIRYGTDNEYPCLTPEYIYANYSYEIIDEDTLVTRLKSRFESAKTLQMYLDSVYPIFDEPVVSFKALFHNQLLASSGKHWISKDDMKSISYWMTQDPTGMLRAEALRLYDFDFDSMATAHLFPSHSMAGKRINDCISAANKRKVKLPPVPTSYKWPLNFFKTL